MTANICPEEQQESLSALGSKDECAKLARRLGIDKLIKCSPRQSRTGPQPVTLKNTLSAIVATAYYDSGSMETVFQVMASLGFVLCSGEVACNN
jgi:dsRNA-specific ribonuclease